jgi:hypothetical protein
MGLMACPFPGMDPYLEDPAFWPDFHRSFITYLRDALLDQLPTSYDARVDEQLRLVEYPQDLRTIYPDVAVTRNPGRSPGAERGSATVATLEPVTVPAMVSIEDRDVWIEVRHLPDQSVVTIIEVLSPANKRGEGFHEYLARRRAILERRVSLVEIDLLLDGARMDFGPRMPRDHYRVLVTRATRRTELDVYAWSIRDRLPAIPVPLREPDPDVAADLAAVFAETYRRGRYARALRYHRPPPGPLADADSAWATERVRATLAQPT